jgi:hypothetical protein
MSPHRSLLSAYISLKSSSETASGCAPADPYATAVPCTPTHVTKGGCVSERVERHDRAVLGRAAGPVVRCRGVQELIAVMREYFVGVVGVLEAGCLCGAVNRAVDHDVWRAGRT